MNKPRIKLIGGVWRCQSGESLSVGQTPRQAFNRWLEATIMAVLLQYGQAKPVVERPKPKPQRARARPQKPQALGGVDIPVFVAVPLGWTAGERLMTWARQSDRGDPLKVLERRQEPPPARTCAGCKEIRLITSPFGGRRVLRCALGEEIGQRCSKYQERPAP